MTELAYIALVKAIKSKYNKCEAREIVAAENGDSGAFALENYAKRNYLEVLELLELAYNNDLTALEI